MFLVMKTIDLLHRYIVVFGLLALPPTIRPIPIIINIIPGIARNPNECRTTSGSYVVVYDVTTVYVEYSAIIFV